MNCAVIVAAGSGKRMGASIPKQFLELDGRPILSYTIEKFDTSEDIDEIVIVTNAENTEYVKNVIATPFKKVKTVVAGGAERSNSVFNGLSALDKSCDTVLIHDGVRPFVTHEQIKRIIDKTREYGCCVLGMPVKDTIKLCDSGGIVQTTPDRNLLWQAQTPQAFSYDIILNAHKQAIADGFQCTDDSMLTERLGHKTVMVEGSYENIKITTPEDMDIGAKILERQKLQNKRKEG